MASPFARFILKVVDRRTQPLRHISDCMIRIKNF